MSNNKLFDIPATPVERVFIVEAYAGNRIAVKLMRLLKADKIYKVKRLRDNNKDFTIFEVSINSTETLETAFKKLKEEIISYIPDNFAPNYLFSVGIVKMGFTYSFRLSHGEGLNTLTALFFHKIKEINKNSVMPTKQIHRSE